MDLWEILKPDKVCSRWPGRAGILAGRLLIHSPEFQIDRHVDAR